jgi:DUF1009 family protein
LCLPGFDPAPDVFWQGDTAELTQDATTWLAALRADNIDAPAAGAVLFKAPKPGQERRADLPTIGPGTALGAARAGFDGIIVEAGGVIVLEAARVIAILDAMQMFLWVRQP